MILEQTLCLPLVATEPGSQQNDQEGAGKDCQGQSRELKYWVAISRECHAPAPLTDSHQTREQVYLNYTWSHSHTHRHTYTHSIDYYKI